MTVSGMCLQAMVRLDLSTNAIFCVENADGSDHHAFHFLVDLPVEALFQEVAHRFKCDPQDIELSVAGIDGGPRVSLNQLKQQTLLQAGLRAEPDLRHKITLTSLKDVGRDIDGRTGNDDKVAIIPLGPIVLPETNPSAVGDLAPPPEPPPPPPAVIQPPNHWAAIAGNEVPSSSTVPYVGLVNQAMTCYLNSLLQALFMTPEFRNALYHWEYNGLESGGESKSMPYQLQKLFLNLQTSTRASVETTALTRSFGWDSSEAWQQHDIQELCRVMFDALEQQFKDTDQADLINRLYEGTMTDYVKCLECLTEKHREDKFLDIPLPVRPFGSSVAYSSVEEALRAFVQPETLDGNNQYHCERCNKKCDAHKGLKFTKFPYLLTLHLKRFDFDYSTLNRIKLNDKVSFPEKLNLNSFILSTAEGEAVGETSEEVVKCDDSSTTDSGSALDDDSAVDTPTTTNHTDYPEDDEGIDVTNSHESEKNRFNLSGSGDTGPYIYELFSIMIHSGSASGGHYYAYIKDFTHGEWFCFNDQSVTRITQEDIKKTYGGGRGYYSGAFSASTNAYMLMYRQVDAGRNATAMTADQFPPHIKELVVLIEEQKEIEFMRRKREQDLMRFKCHYQPRDEPMKDFRICVDCDSTLRETTVAAIRCANLESSIPIEQCRLVSYDRGTGVIECSFDGHDEDTISELMKNCYKSELLLEVREKDQVFQVHRPGDITTNVLVINPVTEEVEGPITVRGNLDITVAEYKAAVASALQTEPINTHILIDKYNSDPEMLINDEVTLKSAGFFPNNRVFALCGVLADVTRVPPIVDRAKNVITLLVALPIVTKDALAELNFPSLEEGCAFCRLDGGGGDHERDRERALSPQPLPDPEDPLTGPQSDQSASEDSSLTDSERTIVGEAPGQSPGLSPPGGSPVAWEHNTSSPENEAVDVEPRVINWTEDARSRKLHRAAVGKLSPRRRDISGDLSNEEEDDLDVSYFKATPYQEGSQRMLRVLMDKRMNVRQLKEHLKPHVGVCVDYFKVFRSNNGQETECVRPTDTFKMSRVEDHLVVRLGRALRKGECPGKVYLFDIKNPQPDSFLVEWVIAAGARVSTIKSEILGEVRRKCNLDIPFDRCRLRQKKWNDAGKPYLDDTYFRDITASWDLYLQELPGPEPVTNADDRLLLFVRQWCPSSLEIRPLVELVLDSDLVSDLKQKISELSEIAVDNVEIGKMKGSFACGEVNVRRIHSDVEWNPDTDKLGNYPLNITEHGAVIIYRDKSEKLKAMTHEERKEFVSGEKRLVRRFHSGKTERALKIYVNNSPTRKRGDDDVD